MAWRGGWKPLSVPGVGGGLLCAGIQTISHPRGLWRGSDNSNRGRLELDVGVNALASPEALGRG